MYAKAYLIFDIMYAMIDSYAFSQWLESAMSERDLTQAELARRAGVTRAAINGILTGARGPGPDLCLAIAGALHLSPETVFRAAGLLPQSPDITPNLEDANHLFAQLSPEDQADILALIRTKIERRDKNKRGGNTPG